MEQGRQELGKNTIIVQGPRSNSDLPHLLITIHRNARDNKFSNRGMKGRGGREGRRSRNVRRGGRTLRSRKARRGTDSALADVSPEQELLVRSNNVTVNGGTTEVVGVGK